MPQHPVPPGQLPGGPNGQQGGNPGGGPGGPGGMRMPVSQQQQQMMMQSGGMRVTRVRLINGKI